MSQPSCPDFAPISLDHAQAYLERYAATPQKVSDYSFVNLFGWRNIYGLEWCFKKLVWIRQTIPEVRYWAPVGDWNSVDWADCTMLGEADTFIRVPEALALQWDDQQGLAAREDPDHHDYVYETHALAELVGNKYHKKKNLFKQFEKRYDYEYKPLDTDCMEEAVDMQEKWCADRECEENESLVAENEVAHEVLENWDRLPMLLGAGLHADGKLVAYTVAEPLDDDTLVVHFEKGNTAYKGVYQTINKRFNESVTGEYTYVNREQDLGNPGLRKAKESYHPVRMMKKYKVVRG